MKFAKMWKIPADIILLHMCTYIKSYDVWFLRYKVQKTKFFVILDQFFCPLTLLTTQKNKNFEKITKYLVILSFYTCVPQITIMMYGSWYIRQNISRQTEFFVILGYFLPFYHTNNPENQNLEKMKKAPGDIIIYTSVP